MYEIRKNPPGYRGDRINPFFRAMAEENTKPREIPAYEDLGAEPDTTCRMPSLAMVYSPVQCWGHLLSEGDALAQGTLFGDLVKPFCGMRVTASRRG